MFSRFSLYFFLPFLLPLLLPFVHRFLFQTLPALSLVVIVGLLTLPVLAVALSWLQFDAQARSILLQMVQTVLPDYAWTSLLLCVAVADRKSVV